MSSSRVKTNTGDTNDSKATVTPPNPKAIGLGPTGEIHDFYAVRDVDPQTKRCRIRAAQKPMTDKKTVEIDYELTRYQLEPKQYRNGSTVRIPAMFWLRLFDVKLIKELMTSAGKFAPPNAICRKQWGSHIFLDSAAQMQVLRAGFNEKNIYTIQDPIPVHSVYPVLKNYSLPKNSPSLVLGMRFSSKSEPKGDRTFGSESDPTVNSDGVCDITEDFIDPTSKSVNYLSDEFKTERRKYAFYVCEDTRLIVTDDRGYKSPDSRVTVSLFQQGSLVILETPKGFELRLCPGFYQKHKKPKDKDSPPEDMEASMDSLDSKTQSVTSLKDEFVMKPLQTKWHQLGKKQFFDKKWFHSDVPEEDRDEKGIPGYTNDKLNEQRRIVIFLGATESQFNTVCWRLDIDTNDTKECVLWPPDGARIMDVMTWNRGFQQITARHRYQRLFESVLYPDIHSTLDFKVPEDQKLLKRILGLYEKDSWLPPIIIIDTSKQFKKHRHPDYLKPALKVYQRMSYIEGVCERDDWTAPHPYTVQPLHPPFIEVTATEKHLFYLKYGECPHIVKDKLYKIDGQTYEQFVKLIPEYTWKLVGRVNEKRELIDKHLEEYRIGCDYMVYRTPFDRIGLINSSFFMKIAPDGKTSPQSI